MDSALERNSVHDAMVFLQICHGRPLNAPVSMRRLFAYDDAQRYRIGPNFGLLPVNRPRCPFFNNRQDGPMNFADQKGEINYYPSSFANEVLLKAESSTCCRNQHELRDYT